jgi:ubiquinone/menaquinone biosynthesis C-methylase UbiE
MTDTRQRAFTPQVDRGIYVGPGYISPSRFASYAYQLQEIISLRPDRVLEVGIGNGLVSYMLRRMGLDVTTLDFDDSLEPDVVASVTDMPVGNASFDAVACFEVLEHLPFERFITALSELRRVSSAYVVVSLPERTRIYKVEAQLPKLGSRRWSFGVPFLKAPEHVLGGEHYWEVGAHGYNLGRVRECFEQAGLHIEKTYRLWENLYHRMFVTSV